MLNLTLNATRFQHCFHKAQPELLQSVRRAAAAREMPNVQCEVYWAAAAMCPTVASYALRASMTDAAVLLVFQFFP
jgi:hypothetical protein